jgi:hypothetical protein
MASRGRKERKVTRIKKARGRQKEEEKRKSGRFRRREKKERP